MNLTSQHHSYIVGGALRQDASTYIRRQADQALIQALQAGEYCYIFNARQMGKSSLRVQATQQLQAQGIRCGIVEVSSIVSNRITAAEWYLGLIRRLKRSLGLTLKVMPWWKERDGLSPIQRFSEFIEDVLLRELTAPIVIFIDEIDSLFAFDFNDDFFALIRDFYQQRAEHQVFRRLSFVLLGVATPSDLIRDKQRTSFNIGGQTIDLCGFHPHEVGPLEAGLRQQVEEPAAVLREVLKWTGGQPFLTQRLCRLIAASEFSICAGHEADLVEQIVRSRVIKDWETQDESVHLKTIRDRLLADESLSGELLGLYQQVLDAEALGCDAVAVDGSLKQIMLRLSGLVYEQNKSLCVYNRIYREIFDQGWINEALANLRPYNKPISAWLVSGQQNDALLLRGKELEAALEWAETRSLSKQDYQFLVESQKLGLRTELEQVQAILDSAHAQLTTRCNELDNINHHLHVARAEAEESKREAEALEERVVVQSRNLEDIFEISEAVVTYAQGQPEAAIVRFSAILAANPQNSFALMARGETYLKLDEPEAALKDFEQAIWLAQELGQETPLAYLGLGNAIAKTNHERWEEALTAYNKAIELKPDYDEAWTSRGNLLASQGKLLEAANLYNFALEKNRYNEAARKNLKASLNRLLEDFGSISTQSVCLSRGSILPGSQNYQDVEEMTLSGFDLTGQRLDGRVRRILVRSSELLLQKVLNDSDALLYRGIALSGQQAIEQFNQAILARPDFTCAYFWRANANAEQGSLKAAIADYTAAINLNPQYSVAYNNRGLAHSDQGDFAAAIADYTTAIALNPKFAVAYNNRGVAHCKQGNFSMACEDYVTAIGLAPKDASAYVNLGNINLKQGDILVAISNYTIAIKLDSEYAAAYVNRGNAFFQKGNCELAIVDYTAAIELEPEDAAVAYVNRGNVNLKSENFLAAIRDYTAAIEFEPRFSVAYNNRGWAHLKRGSFSAAIADYTIAIDFNPENSVAYYNRSWAYFKQGDFAAAMGDYTIAVNLNPQDSEVDEDRGWTHFKQGEFAAEIMDHTTATDLEPKDALTYYIRGWAR